MNITECKLAGYFYSKTLSVIYGQYYTFPKTKLSKNWISLNSTLTFYDTENVGKANLC